MIARLTILGGGSVTAEYYLPALARMGRLGAVIVVDPDPHSIAALGAEFPDVEYRTGDHAAHLASLGTCEPSGHDAVVVALPNHLHVEAVRLALEAGRHVLCEKPLALRAEDCTRLRKLAVERHRQLKVAMSRRYLPSLMLAREMVAARELGEVRAVRVHDCMPFLWRPRSFAFFAPSAGGILADMGVHYLDWLATLLGELTPVSYSDDAGGGLESTVRYRLDANGVPIDMRLSRIEQSGAFVEIQCERGTLRIDKSNEREVVATPTAKPARRIGVEQPFADPAWPASFHGSFCQMLADFDRALDGRETSIADVRDAEHTVALIEWAYRRHEANPRPRHAPRPATSAPPLALVTGATGFIGGHLVERLAADGAAVRVAARSPAKCANVARFPVEIRGTDLLDPASVRAAIEGARIVYHLAYGTDGRDPARITIEGTKTVVEAAIAAGVECVVILSTMYVFGFPAGSRPVDEAFPYAPYGGVYGTSKAAMEQWCLARAATSRPTRIVVLNPTCVFGPGGGAYTTLPVDLASNGQFCWISDGRGACNYVYVANLVDAMLAAAATERAHGERFIVNDGTTTWRRFLAPLLAPLGRTIPSYTPLELERLPRHGGPFKLRDLAAAVMSAPEVRTVAKRSAAVRKLFQSKPWLPAAAASPRQDTAPAMAYPPDWLGPLFSPAETVFSAAKARDVLGWHPRFDLTHAQAATLSWLIDSGRLPGQDAAEAAE